MRRLIVITNKLPDITVVFLLSAMFVIINLQVFFRYFLNLPLDWSEEISRLFLIWMTFIGSSVAVKRNEHLMVEMFINKFPPRLRSHWLRGLRIVSILILLMIIVSSFELLDMTRNQPSAILGFPTSLFFLSLPIGFLLMIVYLFNQILRGEKSSSKARTR